MVREYKIRKWLLLGGLWAVMLTGCGNSAKHHRMLLRKQLLMKWKRLLLLNLILLEESGRCWHLPDQVLRWRIIIMKNIRAKPWKKEIKEQEGVLSDNRYTEYSRAILALTAIGDDSKDVAGYDLTKALEDYDTVVSQGLNGAVFALLALNADRLDVDGPLEKQYLDFILEKEKPEGRFFFE